MVVSGREEGISEVGREEDEKYLEPSVATVGIEQYGTKLKVSLNEEMQALMIVYIVHKEARQGNFDCKVSILENKNGTIAAHREPETGTECQKEKVGTEPVLHR